MMNINQQSVRNLQNRAMQQLRSELPFFPVSLLAIAFLLRILSSSHVHLRFW